MPNLTCSVQKCSHNAGGLCCLPAIHVNGGGKVEHTDCGSYSCHGAITDSVAIPSTQTGICCDAQDCRYNDHCACTASSVKVCHCHDPKESTTECATFCDKNK